MHLKQTSLFESKENEFAKTKLTFDAKRTKHIINSTNLILVVWANIKIID
jgi:hypothetical protein